MLDFWIIKKIEEDRRRDQDRDSIPREAPMEISQDIPMSDLPSPANDPSGSDTVKRGVTIIEL